MRLLQVPEITEFLGVSITATGRGQVRRRRPAIGDEEGADVARALRDALSA